MRELTLCLVEIVMKKSAIAAIAWVITQESAASSAATKSLDRALPENIEVANTRARVHGRRATGSAETRAIDVHHDVIDAEKAGSEVVEEEQPEIKWEEIAAAVVRDHKIAKPLEMMIGIAHQFDVAAKRPVSIT